MLVVKVSIVEVRQGLCRPPQIDMVSLRAQGYPNGDGLPHTVDSGSGWAGLRVSGEVDRSSPHRGGGGGGG